MNEIIRIPNIENYTIEIINGELIATPKMLFITEFELTNIDLAHSTIKKCIIKRGVEIISIDKIYYRPICIDIWKSMPTQKILQETTFNFKLSNENGYNGYLWCEDINMSFQNKDAKNTIIEILKMIKVNNYYIDLIIKLQTGKIINYKNY